MDKEKPSSAVDRLKDNSLKTAGYGYLIGDAAIIAAGLTDSTKKDWGEKGRYAAVGAYWALGGLAAARYGNPSAEKELELLSKRLGEYLKKQHIEIPDSPTTSSLTKPSGVIDTIEDFLYQHPSQALNSIYALGAGQLIYSGIKDLGKAENKNAKILARLDTTSGILIAAGALAGLLIKEKAPDPTHPAHSRWEKAMAWVQEKPLRVSGWLYHANNATMLGATYFKHQAHPESKNYLWRALTAVSYIFANTMLQFSSKQGGTASNVDQDKQTMAALAEKSALVIAAQPKEIQEALIEQISGFLASQHEVSLKAPEIAAILHDKLSTVSAPSHQPANWSQRLENTSPSAPMATR
ncbi:MAG: hypothetical protein SFW63_08740 [Alphaproteobacteria bacterium]|nr:hypothetical protein [Alphaproteobacteria bacterium]